MLVVIPDQLPWEIALTGDVDGETADVSIAVSDANGDPFYVVRTVERTGERFSDAGAVTGMQTDRAAIASMAVLGLLLERIPQGKPDQMRAAMRTAARKSADLGLAGSEWLPEAIVVDGVAFALRVRRLPEGFAATADLGSRVVAMWGAELPPELGFRLEPID